MSSRFRRFGCLLIAVLLASGPALTAPRARGLGHADPRIVQVSPLVDANGDGVSDALAAKLAERTSAATASAQQTVDLIVALDHPPTVVDAEAVSAAGGEVLEGWSDLVYAVHVALPADLVWTLPSLPGVVLVEEDAKCRATLYLSTRQTRARQVWSPPYSLQGDADHNIAILDTGLDGSHPDLSYTSYPYPDPAAKVPGWADEIGPDASSPAPGYYTEPIDMGGHGSHVAGIAAGLGNAAGITAGVGTLSITSSMVFPSKSNSGYLSFFPVDTTGASGNSTLTSRLKWADSSTYRGTVYLRQYNSADSTLSSASAINTATQPLTTTYSSLASGIRNYAYYAFPYKNWSGVSPYWVQTTTPMTGIGDGYNLMRGVAPGASLVGVKVLDNTGNGTISSVINGLTWVADNKSTYHIVAANLSLGAESISASFDTAVNNLVAAGVVVACSAGNGRGSSYPYVYSPASASKAIAVAATSDEDRITDYSSYGGVGDSKPDIAAPGGSFVTYRAIVSVDSNSSEVNDDASSPWAVLNPEAYPNDYYGMWGTSMASPHVAGAAALVAEAMGTWDWTEDQALRVKTLLEMTATETNNASGAEAAPSPTLDRGGGDISEGFGRLNIDAAVEAATMSCPIGSPVTATLGLQATDKKCWARHIILGAGITYTITLTNPAGGDYDLYLFKDTYTNDGSVSLGSIGDPIIAAKSTSAGLGVSESITYTPSTAEKCYVVAKRVAGGGEFSLHATSSLLGVSVTPTTGWTLGAVGKGAVKTTWTRSVPAQGGYFSAKNEEGSLAEDLWMKVANSAAWTAGSSPGPNTFAIGWGQTQTQEVEPGYGMLTESGVLLVDGLAPGDSSAFDLQFRAPTSSTSSTMQSIVVTVEAYGAP